ncbi:MAG: BBP7 family outer membrane beta-barrel protein [Planctomycetia bacterium]|nr:BBP7 family outer membrane beta-barrel protein [Planctomycetia bacterium]
MRQSETLERRGVSVRPMLWAAVSAACAVIGPSFAEEPTDATVDQAVMMADSGPDTTLPSPMYVADPLDRDTFAAMPVGIGSGLAKSWPRWFAGASGLVMTRTLPAGTATMRPLGGTQLTTADAAANWPGGIDLHLGRWFGMRQQHAVEAIYWGVYNIGTSSSVTSGAGAIDAIPQASGVTVAGLPAATFLTGATAQQINRSDVVNDIEINWVYSLWDRPEFLPRERAVNLMWLAGFRFFQVGDTLTLQNGTGDPSLGGLDFDVATNNNIYGAQVGAKFDWRVLPMVRLNIVPKFMVGGNSITNTSSLVRTNGTYGTFTADGSPSQVHSTLGVFSWLGSVDTAVAWDVTDQWSLWMGYRVVGVGNIAQADGQWPTDITSPTSLSGIAAGSSTIVHGGFAGFEGRY